VVSYWLRHTIPNLFTSSGLPVFLGTKGGPFHDDLGAIVLMVAVLPALCFQSSLYADVRAPRHEFGDALPKITKRHTPMKFGFLLAVTIRTIPIEVGRYL
jgi:hypothetical protein